MFRVGDIIRVKDGVMWVGGDWSGVVAICYSVNDRSLSKGYAWFNCITPPPSNWTRLDFAISREPQSDVEIVAHAEGVPTDGHDAVHKFRFVTPNGASVPDPADDLSVLF